MSARDFRRLGSGNAPTKDFEGRNILVSYHRGDEEKPAAGVDAPRFSARRPQYELDVAVFLQRKAARKP